MSTAVLVFVAVAEEMEDLGGLREGGYWDVVKRGLNVWDGGEIAKGHFFLLFFQ